MRKQAQRKRKIFLVSIVFLLSLLLFFLLRGTGLISSTRPIRSTGSQSSRGIKTPLLNEEELAKRKQELKLEEQRRDKLLDVSTWKVYESRGFRIRFSVPQEAEVIVQNDHLLISLFRYDSEFYVPTTIYFEGNRKRLSIDQWFSESSPPSSEMIKRFRHYSVKGREATSFRMDYISPGPLQFYINFGDIIVSISPMDSGDPMNVIYQDDIRTRIVDTIERID